MHDTYLGNYFATGVPKMRGLKRRVLGLRKDGSIFPLRLAVFKVDTPEGVCFIGVLDALPDDNAPVCAI
jgi:hypothetical protein